MVWKMWFKVIEVGINRKVVCDFLLVINRNDIQSRTVSELSQLIVQILDTLHFWATLWGLGTSYDVHLGLIGKRGKLPISVNWTFFAVDTTEALWAKIDLKSAIRSNDLQLSRWQFSHKLCSRLSSWKRSAILDEKWPFCVFEPPLGGA